MADYERYSNQDRDRYRERCRERGRFEDQRPDDRNRYGAASSGAPSAEGGLPRGGVDQGVGGYGQRRYGTDYGRDDRYGSTYGGFEEPSFTSRGGDYGGNPYGGYDANRGRRDDSRHEPSAWRGRERHDAESYAFTPTDLYGAAFAGDPSRRERPYRGHDFDRHRDHDRGFWDRAADRVQSMLGDDEAKARLRGDHAGRGPKGYKRSDDRIREDVSDRLSDDSWLDASDIEVMVSDTEITLSGTVSDRDAKRRAESLAEGVSGASHVQNNLRVSQHDRPGGLTEAGDGHNTVLTRQAAGRA